MSQKGTAPAAKPVEKKPEPAGRGRPTEAKTPEQIAAKKKEKRERFKKVAAIRGNKAIGAIRSLAAVTNTYSYDRSADDLKKIVKTLRDEVDALETKYEAALMGGSDDKETPALAFD